MGDATAAKAASGHLLQRLFIWHGGAAFHESKTSVFQIAMTMVCRDLPQLANGSKTTRFLLRFDY
jgi:hypothetical protein